MRRVVITGRGIVSSIGCSVDSAFERLKIYKNAVIHSAELEEYQKLNSKLASPVLDFKIPKHFTRKVLRTMGPVSIMAVASAEDALKDAGLLGSDEIQSGNTGVAYGSSSGSIDPIIDFHSMITTKEVKNINSGTYIKMMPQTCAVNLSLYLKTTGRLLPTGTACTSGSLSIGLGYETIREGKQDIMIVGGAEEFDATQVAVFDTLYATSTKNDTPELTPAPFDANRDGLVIGEGAGTLILEEYEHAKKRGAKIYAEIVGFGTNTDGTHITNPNYKTMGNSMQLALKDAGISSDEIGYINAHGTATAQGDVAESIATHNVFNREIPISSLKSYIGHTLGACGAIEAILSVNMMNNNWYAPTLNLNKVDDQCGKLDYIMNEGRSMSCQYIMSNNFAFGGINTSVIYKKI